MADDRSGGNPPKLPKPRQRVFDGKQGGLRIKRPVELLSVRIFGDISVPTQHFLQIDPLAFNLFLPAPALRINDFPDIRPQVGLEDAGAAVNLLFENVPGLIEIVSHAHVMIPNAG